MAAGDDEPRAVSSVRTREAVRALLGRGFSRVRIAETLGVTKGTVTYHARRLDEPIDQRFSRRYDWPAIQRAYDGGLTMKQCMDRFGFSSASWYQAIKRGEIQSRAAETPLNQILDFGPRRGRENLKRRLVKAGLKQNRCEVCGIESWRGRPLSVALHHVNGDGRDNRLENLQFLCPNCHSQTPNYGGRNGRRRSVRDRGRVPV